MIGQSACTVRAGHVSTAPCRASQTNRTAAAPVRSLACNRQAAQRISRARLRVSAAGGSGSTAVDTPTGAQVPPLLNAIPHDREIRRHFYREASDAAAAAVAAGEKRIEVRCTIPELNTEFDVFRIGTLLELVRELASTLAADGRRVRVCVQQPLGQGVFAGTPLSLNGVGRLMTMMDWGPAAEFISHGGKISAEEAEKGDIFVLIAPQNIVGHSILPFLDEMVEAAGAQGKPVVLINPKLGDIQSSGGIMGVRGRQGRLDFAATFVTAYHFRLLYLGASMYPIMGALRFSYGGPWEVFKRVELGHKQEEYRWIAGFMGAEPTPKLITEAFQRSRQGS